MNEYCYDVRGKNNILLYKIENGKTEPLEVFKNRDDLLKYVEQQGYSKLYILR